MPRKKRVLKILTMFGIYIRDIITSGRQVRICHIIYNVAYSMPNGLNIRFIKRPKEVLAKFAASGTPILETFPAPSTETLIGVES